MLSLPEGTRIARRYRLLEQLGRGQAAGVYLAEDVRRRGLRVALKVLDEDTAQATSFDHRFAVNTREVGFDKESGRSYVVMDLVEGSSLAQLIGRGKLPPERAVRLARQLLVVLAAAHEQGLVHRALTPTKVLVTRPGAPDEEVRVLGFALASTAGAAARPPANRFTRQAEALRERVAQRDPRLRTKTRIQPLPQPSILRQTQSLAYASPEVLLGRPFDARADLYSVGALLYAAITRVPPFEIPRGVKDPEAHLRLEIEGRDPFPIQRRVRDLPDELARLIEKALSKSAHDRPADAHVFRRDLRRALNKPSVALLQPGTSDAQRVVPEPDPHDLHEEAWTGAPEKPKGPIVIRPEGSKLVIRKGDLGPQPEITRGMRMALAVALLCFVFGMSGMLVHFARARVWGGTRFVTIAHGEGATSPPRPEWAASGDFPERLPSGLDWTENPGEVVARQDGSIYRYVPAGVTHLRSGTTAEVSAMWIGKHEVTWGQLLRFKHGNKGDPLPPLRIGGRRPTHFVTGDHPAADVSVELAKAYASWSGARLPSEAEWVMASQGPKPKPYPWGEAEPKSEDYGVVDGSSTWPVGSAPANQSHFGLLDTYRNAAEWLNDGRLIDWQIVYPPDDESAEAPSEASKSEEGEAKEGDEAEEQEAPRVPARGFRLVIDPVPE